MLARKTTLIILHRLSQFTNVKELAMLSTSNRSILQQTTRQSVGAKARARPLSMAVLQIRSCTKVSPGSIRGRSLRQICSVEIQAASSYNFQSGSQKALALPDKTICSQHRLEGLRIDRDRRRSQISVTIKNLSNRWHLTRG